MKRILFVALAAFLVGLGLLLWIDRKPGDVQPLPEPTLRGPSAQAERGEVVAVPDAKGAVTQVSSDGPLRVSDTYPELGTRRHVLTAEDHRSRGEGAADLEKLEVSLFASDGAVLLRKLNAARGRVHLEFTDGRPRLSETLPGTFEDVTVSIEGGSQFAPLTLGVPELALEFGTQVLRSERDVTVAGRGLQANGSGLYGEGESGLLRIERKPRVTLELEDGSRATLSAGGPLTFENRPDLGPDLAELRAEGGATLSFLGAEALHVDARLVRLLVSVGENRERFSPQRVEAEGDVVLRRDEGRFLGDVGLLTFTAEGRPRRAELRGSPRASIELHGVGYEGGKRIDTPEARLPIEALGREVLTVDFGVGISFELDGPATVSLPSLSTTLVAQQSIRGVRDPSGGYETITAEGDVLVTSPTETLRSEIVDVEALSDATGEVYARATTRGRTHAEGELEPQGDRFVLDAEDGLVYVRRGSGFFVPRAGRVTLAVGGAEAFRAGALEVRDLDGVRRTFEAEGDVWYEGVHGRARGERLVARGPRQAEFFGAPALPVRFWLPQGELSALRVELDGRRLRAEGEVEADLAEDGTRLTLSSRWLDLDEGREAAGGQEGSDWRLDAGGEVSALLERGAERHAIVSDLLRVRADELEREAGASDEGLGRLDPISLEAIGNVVVDYFAGFSVHAEGERLFLDAQGNAQLLPAGGERVRVRADDPLRGLQLELDADSIDYGMERMVAVRPDFTVDGLDLPVLGGSVPGDRPRLHAVAGRMALDRRSMLLSEGAYVARVSPLAQGWSLDAEQILLSGDPDHEAVEGGQGLPLEGPFEELYAWGGFVASGSDALQARGERLAVSGPSDRITITGSPATVVGNGVTWSSDWFELDGSSRSIRSSAGQMDIAGGGVRGPWTVRYASMEPIESEDTTIQVLREPVMAGSEEELRGAWALFWVDTRRWQRMSGAGAPGLEGIEDVERRARPRSYSLFGEVEALGELEWLREFYMEGNVEYIVRGESRARAGAIYLDLIDGQGWVREADVETDLPVSRGRTPVKIRTEWLRHSADGVYRAENAVATTCSFEDPHYVVRIGSFGMRPRARRQRTSDATPQSETFDGWDVEAKRNRLILWRNFGIPLPKIGLPTDDEYKVETDAVSVFGMRPFSFGSDAKFGTFVGTSFAFDLSWLVSWARGLFGRGSSSGGGGNVEGGKGDLHVRWFNQRGLLLGVDVPFWDPGRFWVDTSFSGIFDTGEDKGLVRVPEDERDLFRGWLHQRGRYLLGEREWIDGALTWQTDPGVQAEFFEGDYLQYEERETYLHWRKASGDRYAGATLEGQLNNFYTEIQDQPAGVGLDGKSQVGTAAGLPVYYGSKTTVGRYVRIEDSSGYEDPFPDGLGERTVARFDTLHRLEVPVDLGFGGLRATPYVDGRLSAWDEGADPDEDPLRAGILTGATLATTFFRTYSGGARHAVSPIVGVRTDLATSGDDDALVPIDTTEIPLEGTFVDLGLRSRWTYGERRDSLDLGLTATHVTDSSAFPDDGWAPLAFRGFWFSSLMGVPFMVSSDLRYDPDDQLTAYSRTLFGFEPIPSVDVELGHHFGRDPDDDSTLFDAASIGARYLFSPKWELDARQTVSSLDDGRLASSLGITRIGHDFVFELDTRFVAGEGNSVSVSMTPLVMWRRGGFSYLDHARRHGD